MTSRSSGNITSALARIGGDPTWRDRFVAMLKDFERTARIPEVNVREEITGPIIDALYQNVGILSKTLSSGVVVQFRYLSKISRDIVMADERPDHLWEPQTTKLLLRIAPDVQRAIIGGAYFGDHAVLLAHAMRRTGGICHCFEVNPDQLELLRLNVATNGLENVVINSLGLWDRDDVILELVGDDSHASPREALGSAGPEGIRTISVDTYAEKRRVGKIGLIMLDIEGGELAALRGARRCLELPPDEAPIVIFEVHRSYVDWSKGLENTEIIRLLESRGCQVYAIRDYQSNVPMKDRPVEIVPVRDVYLEGPPHGFNMLAIKRAELIEQYGLRICRGVSPKLLLHRDPRLHQPLH